MENKPEQLWKINDRNAQKSGVKRAIFSVKRKEKNEDGTISGPSNQINSGKQIGEWYENKKHGFGIQYQSNGDKQEGYWHMNRKCGQGTYWKCIGKKKLRRYQTGDFENNLRQGKGSMFQENGDRFDGYWLENNPHGEGRKIYKDGDIQEGQWYQDERSGYGVLTKRSGDQYEGQWIADKKEGQGSYYYASKNKLFVGEWIENQPKCGIQTEVEDENQIKTTHKHQTDPYKLPQLPELGINNPSKVLEQSMNRVKVERSYYRVTHIPLEDMFTVNELADLEKEFLKISYDSPYVELDGLKLLFNQMDLYPSDENLNILFENLGGIDINRVNFDLFSRMTALMLEDSGNTEEDNLYDDDEDY